MNHSMPGLPVHHQLLEFTQTHVHWVSDAIQASHSLSSPSPPALSLSQHQGLFGCSSRPMAKILEFQFPSNEHPGLISFRMDWLDLLAVQRTFKSLLQHHSSKASISCYITANICSVYCVPRTSLDRILVNPYNSFIEPYTLWDSFCYFSHFTDGKIEGKGVK